MRVVSQVLLAAHWLLLRTGVLAFAIIAGSNGYPWLAAWVSLLYVALQDMNT